MSSFRAWRVPANCRGSPLPARPFYQIPFVALRLILPALREPTRICRSRSSGSPLCAGRAPPPRRFDVARQHLSQGFIPPNKPRPLLVTHSPAVRRQWLGWGLRALVLVLVCVGVGHTVRRAIAQLAQYEWSLQPMWLLLAGLAYVGGLMPMAWFWYRTLAALGSPTPFAQAVRAYFWGHLGKYVPGKALAVVLRVAAVRPWVPSIRIAVLSAMLETLTMMAVGASFAAVLSIAALQLPPRVALLALGMAIVSGVPTLPPVARRLGQLGGSRINKKVSSAENAIDVSEIASRIDGINVRLLAAGWLAGITCWILLGASLWATLRSIGVVVPLLSGYGYARLIAAVAFAVVAGFLSMLPGGLVVRDLLLVQLLAGPCDEADALVAAVLLRLIWLVTEALLCGILYVSSRGTAR